MMTHHPSTKQSGFTLVELAIVLVIIGLIVGGVLVGQDLIKAAEIRATVTQLEKYNAAVNTFRDKFGGIPGDMIQSRAEKFAINPFAAGDRAGTDGLGDGDGLIENGPTAAEKQGLGRETVAFWSDMTQADMIPDATTPLPAATPLGVTTYASTAALIAAKAVPSSKLRDSTFIHAYGLNGRNFYYVGGITTVTAATGVLTLAPGLTPIEANAIDEKIDDGDGDEGTVLAILNVTANAEDDGSAGTAAFGEAADCFASNAGVYNASEATGTGINCRLSIRASF